MCPYHNYQLATRHHHWLTTLTPPTLDLIVSVVGAFAGYRDRVLVAELPGHVTRLSGKTVAVQFRQATDTLADRRIDSSISCWGYGLARLQLTARPLQDSPRLMEG